MTLTNEQNNYIISIYELSNRTPRIAVELFEQQYSFRITPDTLRKRWKESKLEIQSSGGCRNKSPKKSYNPIHSLLNNPYAKYLRVRARKI